MDTDQYQFHRTIEALARGEKAALKRGKLGLARLFRQSACDLQTQTACDHADCQGTALRQ